MLVSLRVAAAVLSLIHLGHPLHTWHPLPIHIVVWHISHTSWNSIHELLQVWVILRNILVHILIELSIRSLVLLIIEVLLLVELPAILPLARVSMLPLTLILRIVSLRSNIISLLIWISTSLRSILLLHVSHLILLPLVVLLLPLILLGIVLILLASTLPVELSVYLLVHSIIFIIAMCSCL